MPSIQQNSRAANLLAELREEDRLSLDRLALLIGVPPQVLRDCRARKVVLAPEEQVRLARAIASRVPRLASRARNLESQAAAAMRIELGATRLHLTAPAKWY